LRPEESRRGFRAWHCPLLTSSATSASVFPLRDNLLNIVSAAIQIRREIVVAMREEVAKTPRQECCGLLAGRNGIISESFPARNAHPNPAAGYEIAPQELFQFMREIRAHDLQLLGIYHSHPRGENFPSRTDIEHAYYPDTPYFILSPLPDAPQPVRAFLIRDGEVKKLDIKAI
jgi:proteasome lid subunit RPN8/RPN11